MKKIKCLDCDNMFTPYNGKHVRCGGQNNKGSCSYNHTMRTSEIRRKKERIKICKRCKCDFVTTSQIKEYCGYRYDKESCLFKHLEDKNMNNTKTKNNNGNNKQKKSDKYLTPREEHRNIVLSHNRKARKVRLIISARMVSTNNNFFHSNAN